jgi:hypothetical protein
VAIPRDLFEVTGFGVSPGAVAPGDTLEVSFGYRRDLPARYGPGVRFHVRFDHQSITSVHRFPGEKYVRRARERFTGRRLRFRADVVAGHGVFESDLWPMGTPLTETFAVRVPNDAAPGVYRVEVRAVEETLLPNFDLVDLLFNRDHYSGVPCATLEIGRAQAAP